MGPTTARQRLARLPGARQGAAEAGRDPLAPGPPGGGFGFVSQKLESKSPKAAAAYLSSYFITGKREKAQLQESVKHPALAGGRLIWLTSKLTLKTGVTMRELRFRRFVWARYSHFLKVGGKWIDVARALAEIERERGSEVTSEELAELLSQDEFNDWFCQALSMGVVRFADPVEEALEREEAELALA